MAMMMLQANATVTIATHAPKISNRIFDKLTSSSVLLGVQNSFAQIGLKMVRSLSTLATTPAGLVTSSWDHLSIARQPTHLCQAASAR